MDKDVAKRLEAVGFGTAFPNYYMPTGEDTAGIIDKMREAQKNTKFKKPVLRGSALFKNYTAEYVDERSQLRKFFERFYFWRRIGWFMDWRYRNWIPRFFKKAERKWLKQNNIH